MVCEYDYTVRVPKLKIFFRDAVEFNEEEQDDMPIEEIMHCYCEGETEPDYGAYYSILKQVLWYIKDNRLAVENPKELECIIDFPYDVDLKEKP